MAVLREYKFACKGYNICCMARFFIAYALFFASKSTLSGLAAGEGVGVAARGMWRGGQFLMPSCSRSSEGVCPKDSR